MKKSLIQSLTNNFESYSRKAEEGIEFWLARDLIGERFSDVGIMSV